jgi:hypothetical protein
LQLQFYMFWKLAALQKGIKVSKGALLYLRVENKAAGTSEIVQTIYKIIYPHVPGRQ